MYIASDVNVDEDATLASDLQSLEKMDDSPKLEDITFCLVDTLFCYATEKINRVSKMDVVIAFLLAADVVSQSSDDAQAEIVEKIAKTRYIGRVVKSVCQCLQHDSGISWLHVVSCINYLEVMVLFINRGPT